ncbi:MAG: FtsW/RodA/SpoVE family cell cycle protein [Flavonifractor plautii]
MPCPPGTDEIFAVCGEEFGLIGCIVLLLLLGAIICPLHLVWRGGPLCPRLKALFIAMGYAGMLLAQVVVGDRECVSMCSPVVRSLTAAVHQLWRRTPSSLHVCGHGRYLQYQNALPSELAAGSEPYLNQWTGAGRFG